MVAALGSFFCYSTFYCHNGLVLACWLYKLHLAIPFVFFKIFSHCSLPPFPLGNVCNKASDATGATDTNVLTLAHNAGDGNSACLPFRVIISQLQQYCTGVCFEYDTALLLFLGNRNSLARTLSSTPNLELRSVSACCTVSAYDCANGFETTLCKNMANVYIPLGTQSWQHFHEELICKVWALRLQVPFAPCLFLTLAGTALQSCSNWTWRTQWRTFSRLVGAASHSKVSRCFGRIWQDQSLKSPQLEQLE